MNILAFCQHLLRPIKLVLADTDILSVADILVYL